MSLPAFNKIGNIAGREWEVWEEG